jgi:hypothetical protein
MSGEQEDREPAAAVRGRRDDNGSVAGGVGGGWERQETSLRLLDREAPWAVCGRCSVPCVSHCSAGAAVADEEGSVRGNMDGHAVAKELAETDSTSVRCMGVGCGNVQP